MDKKVKIFHLQDETTDFIFWMSDIEMLQAAEEWRQQYIDYKNYVQATIEKVCIIVNQKYK
jgi:hypothetical protein